MSDIRQEELLHKQPIPVPIEGVKKILHQMENNICKIYHENGKTGTGFFCNIPLFDKTLPFLITNNHVLNEDAIKNKKSIKVAINGEAKEIKIDDTRKRYTNQDLDITFVEIRPEQDGINTFMELDEDINKKIEILELEYRKKSII